MIQWVKLSVMSEDELKSYISIYSRSSLTSVKDLLRRHTLVKIKLKKELEAKHIYNILYTYYIYEIKLTKTMLNPKCWL